MSHPVVIKIGGKVLDDLDALWKNVKARIQASPVVIVHGGGKSATALAQRLGHEPRKVRGRRITTPLDLQTIEWAIRGSVNLHLVGEALARGLRGVGLSGADGGLVTVTRRPPWTIEGAEVDFGHVGDIEQVNPGVLTPLLQAGYLPIVAALGIGKGGHRFNVNADTVAAAIAVALEAEQLILVTDTGAIRRQADAAETRIHTMDAASLEKGQERGWITDGMMVKCQVAIDALNRGVRSVYVAGPGDVGELKQATQLVL